ncbi:MAG: hypothetical protein AAB512_02410 [Patescibacteria group bacterium]
MDKNTFKSAQIAVLMSIGANYKNLSLESLAIDIELLKQEVKALNLSIESITTPGQRKKLFLSTLKGKLKLTSLNKVHSKFILKIAGDTTLSIVDIKKEVGVNNGKQLIININKKLKMIGYKLKTKNKKIYLTPINIGVLN